jgi:transcriptional regulator with XRE-family HTH domain
MYDSLNKYFLGDLVKSHREQLNLTQQELANEIGDLVNRSHISHLEQGLRLPKNPQVIIAICTKLRIPPKYWEPFTKEKSLKRLEFESILTELVGVPISLVNNDVTVIEVAENLIQEIFSISLSPDQYFHCLLRILVFYDVPNMSHSFFKRFITPDAFKSITAFEQKVKEYQKDAIRLFSSFEESFKVLNSIKDLSNALMPLQIKLDDNYRLRSEWTPIKNIPDEKLPYLGYIAANRVEQESKQRQDLAKFLLDLAERKRKEDSLSLKEYPEKTRRKYDSLLRKFNSKIEHGLFSPLFTPSAETLEREAKFIQPESGTDIQEMGQTQKTAYENLSNYLTADFMDVYVATSMRSDADFVSVNNFVRGLFEHEDIRPLKLRYFNPTQSWIEDRIAKGLVEALMLKRADYCIYMAQKEDTFGKDSEASVSLGQGKPVIVFVPKLNIPEERIDSEELGKLSKSELLEQIKKYDEDFSNDVDESIDLESLTGKLLTHLLDNLSDEIMCLTVQKHWADYDLYGEIEKREMNTKIKTEFIHWADKVIKERKVIPIPATIKDSLIKIFIAATIRYEKRATIFREIHPLALQVILSTGVLNGILVTRSIESSAQILKSLITNKLDLELEIDVNNYRLIEKNTRSTIRVISRHNLLSNAFAAFYRKADSQSD